MMEALKKAFNVVMPERIVPARQAILERGIMPLAEKIPAMEGDVTEIYGVMPILGLAKGVAESEASWREGP